MQKGLLVRGNRDIYDREENQIFGVTEVQETNMIFLHHDGSTHLNDISSGYYYYSRELEVI